LKSEPTAAEGESAEHRMEKGFWHRILVGFSGKAMSVREAGKRQSCVEKAMTDSITELQPNTTMSQCTSLFYGCKLLFPVLYFNFSLFILFIVQSHLFYTIII